MAFKLINESSFPAAIALAGDIMDGVISGSVGAVALIGKTVYITDTPAWYIIDGASASAISVALFKYPTAVS